MPPLAVVKVSTLSPSSLPSRSSSIPFGLLRDQTNLLVLFLLAFFHVAPFPAFAWDNNDTETDRGDDTVENLITVANWHRKTKGPKAVFLKYNMEHICKEPCDQFKPVWNKLVQQFLHHPHVLVGTLDCRDGTPSALLCEKHGAGLRSGWPLVKYGHPQSCGPTETGKCELKLYPKDWPYYEYIALKDFIDRHVIVHVPREDGSRRRRDPVIESGKKNWETLQQQERVRAEGEAEANNTASDANDTDVQGARRLGEEDRELEL